MITIFFQSVELVTLINVTSGNNHNFFLSVALVTFLNFNSGHHHNFFIFSGIGHIFKWNQWKWSQFLSNQWKWSQFFSSVILFLRSWWGHSPGALSSQVHSLSLFKCATPRVWWLGYSWTSGMHSWPSGMPISFTTKSKVTSSIVNCSPDPLDPKVTFRWLTWPPTSSPTCPWTQLFLCCQFYCRFVIETRSHHI
jgi:hypothetical protein